MCRAHDGIARFRATLPALLPIATGAGLVIHLSTIGARTCVGGLGVAGAPRASASPWRGRRSPSGAAFILGDYAFAAWTVWRGDCRPTSRA